MNYYLRLRLNGLYGFAAFVLIVVGGCDPAQPHDPGAAPGSNVASTSDANAHYDPTSLKEVREFSRLPEGVQTLASNSFMKENFDYTPTKFLVGGVDGASAVVAYEQGGYVPSYHAQAYVFRNSHWVPAQRWQLQSETTNLSNLISATAQ
jgi:hypothetical protein